MAAKRPKDNGDKSSYRRSDSESKKEKAPVAQDELTSTPMPDPSPIDTAPNQYYVLEEVHNNPLPVMGNQPTPSTLTSSENDTNNLFNNFLSFFQKAQSGGSQGQSYGRTITPERETTGLEDRRSTRLEVRESGGPIPHTSSTSDGPKGRRSRSPERQHRHYRDQRTGSPELYDETSGFPVRRDPRSRTPERGSIRGHGNLPLDRSCDTAIRGSREWNHPLSTYEESSQAEPRRMYRAEGLRTDSYDNVYAYTRAPGDRFSTLPEVPYARTVPDRKALGHRLYSDRQRDDHAPVVYEGYADPARLGDERDSNVDVLYDGYARDQPTGRFFTDRPDSSGHESDPDSNNLRKRSYDSDESESVAGKRSRLEWDPHFDSDIPFSDLIQGISDSMGLPLTKTTVKPSKKPYACMGSDEESKEEKLLPLSPWLASLWKDLDSDLKGLNSGYAPLEKGKFFKNKISEKKISFKDPIFPLTAQKVQHSAEDIVSTKAKFAPNIDFKAMTELSEDCRRSIALLNNALLMSSTREIIFADMMSYLDVDKLPERFSNLLDTSKVLLKESKKDFGRALTVQTKVLANIELFRRDAVLDKANKKVSKTGVNLLRSSSLLSHKMFEDTLVKEVQELTERSIRFSGPAFSSQRRTRSPSTSTRSFKGKLPYQSASSSFRSSFRSRSPRGRGGSSRGRGGSRGKRFTLPSKK